MTRLIIALALIAVTGRVTETCTFLPRISYGLCNAR